MEKNMSYNKYLVRLAALTALCSSAVLAAPYYANKPYWIFTTIDFSAASTKAGHVDWSTWTTPSGSAGTKYVEIVLSKQFSNAGTCYAINIDDTGPVETADLRFWTWDNRSIDDDGPAGNREPNALLWITSDFTLKVSAFSNSYNNVDFGIYNYIIDGVTTAAGCNDGVTPFYNQVNNTILRADSAVN
jgi:hypothetical protein